MLVKFIHQMLVKILQSPWVVDDGSVNEFFITTFPSSVTDLDIMVLAEANRG